MKRTVALCAIALLGVSPPLKPRAAEEFTDKLCQNATSDVRAYDAKIADPNGLMDDAILLAQKVVDAYNVCAQAKLQNVDAEGTHYAQLRAAQFQFKIGQWQRLSERPETARDALNAAIAEVKETIDWISLAQTVFRSNNVNGANGSSHNSSSRYSVWRDAAIDVRDQAIGELKLLPGGSGPTLAPAPAPKPSGK